MCMHHYKKKKNNKQTTAKKKKNPSIFKIKANGFRTCSHWMLFEGGSFPEIISYDALELAFIYIS